MELSFHIEYWKLYSLTICYYRYAKWPSVPLTKFNLTSCCQISHPNMKRKFHIMNMVRNEQNAHMYSYENKHDQGLTTKQRKHQKASRRYVRYSKCLDGLVRWKTVLPDVRRAATLHVREWCTLCNGSGNLMHMAARKLKKKKRVIQSGNCTSRQVCFTPALGMIVFAEKASENF